VALIVVMRAVERWKTYAPPSRERVFEVRCAVDEPAVWWKNLCFLL